MIIEYHDPRGRPVDTIEIDVKTLDDSYRAFRAMGHTASVAMRYARAELWGAAEQAKSDLRIIVMDDPDIDLSWADDKIRKKIVHDLESGEQWCLGVVVERRVTTAACGFCGHPAQEHWIHAASLWGVFVTGPRDPYLRDTIANELLEAM